MWPARYGYEHMCPVKQNYQHYLSFTFGGAPVTGPESIEYMKVSISDSVKYYSTGLINARIARYGVAGDFIEGPFIGTLRSNSDTAKHAINGTFL